MVLRKPQGKGVFAHLNFALPATDQKPVKLKTGQHCDQNVKKVIIRIPFQPWMLKGSSIPIFAPRTGSFGTGLCEGPQLKEQNPFTTEQAAVLLLQGWEVNTHTGSRTAQEVRGKMTCLFDLIIKQCSPDLGGVIIRQVFSCKIDTSPTTT